MEKLNINSVDSISKLILNTDVGIYRNVQKELEVYKVKKILPIHNIFFFLLVMPTKYGKHCW